MGHRIMHLFEVIETHLGAWTDRITYILMYVNPGHSLAEIHARKIFDEKEKAALDELDANLSAVDPDKVEFVLQQSIKQAATESNRRQVINEKNKILLTVATLLLAANGIIMPSLEPRWISLFSICPIIFALYLILINFGVGETEVVDYNIDYSSKSAVEATQDIARVNFECGIINASRNRFLVGVYQAAQRLILAGIFILLMVLAYATIWNQSGGHGRPETTITIKPQLHRGYTGI